MTDRKETGGGSFRARLLTPPDKMREALEGDAPKGQAEIMLAIYDVPDTHVAFGNKKRQIIDQGAFSGVIKTRDFESRPVPFYIDHGDAHLMGGIVTTTKKVGFLSDFQEVDAETSRAAGGPNEAGLRCTANYNLQKQVGREAYSDLAFDPNGTQFSFRWPANEEVYDGEDGFEHVRAFSDLIEGSQVGIGAQEGTHALAGSIRSAVIEERPHSTEVDASRSWDAEENARRLPEQGAVESFRAAHAWFEVPEDAEPAKVLRTQFSYLHHFVEEGGTVGAASVTACRRGIEALADNLDEKARASVYDHLSGHIKEAGEDAPELPVMRTVIPRHETATSDREWDPQPNLDNLKGVGVPGYRQAFAHFDGSAAAGDDGFPTDMAAYQGSHHFVSTDGTVGAASTRACRSLIEAMNGGSGQADVVPGGNREAVYNHIASHLRDAEVDVPALRSLEDATKADHVKKVRSFVAQVRRDMPGALDELEMILRQPGDGEIDVEQLPSFVRGEWSSLQREARKAQQSLLGQPQDADGYSWSWVESVYAKPGADSRSGHVIVSVDAGEYFSVAWEIEDPPEGSQAERNVKFDVSGAVAVKKDWVVARMSLDMDFVRSATGLNRLRDEIVRDRSLALALKDAVEEGQLENPMVDLYAKLFG